jgi:sterol desaturase/sphingolipid hydroxylase (fatty acid hydroxylase superfamily)
MMYYWDIFWSNLVGYAHYLVQEILHPHWYNYFYWLIAISVICMLLEWSFPWVQRDRNFRKDFWLDAFYMFFNFFLFGLIGYSAISEVCVVFFNNFIHNTFGISNLVAISIKNLPAWLQLFTLFLVRDFVQWNIHRLLHRVSFLWRIHQIHHSVEEMGFAAHLRYHFGETIVYRTLEYIPLAMIGFDIQDFFLVHLFTLSVGHLNHSNIYLPLGKLKYIFNNPQMHIWHHAKHLPNTTGVNFGLTLSIWDYIFKTAYIPHDGKGIPLGFKDVEQFPDDFLMQAKKPFE